MGQKPIVNKMYGRKGLSAMLLALAMLVVATAGAASAEAGTNAQSLENDMATLEAAQQIESDYLLADALLTDDSEIDDNLSDIEPIDDGQNVVIFVWTNGEDALVVVVLFDDEGNWEVTHVARMSVEEARERLANFDGRIIVRHIGDSDVEPVCPHGYLLARWSVNQTATAENGQFKGLWLDAQSNARGKMVGVFADGEFKGRILSLDGDQIGQFKGVYGEGQYRGVWEIANSQGTTDETLNGVFAGKYRATEPGQGLMKGKWKANCADQPGIEPVPVDPIVIKCQKLTADAAEAEADLDVEETRCKVKPIDRPDHIKPGHGSDDVSVKPMDTQQREGMEQVGTMEEMKGEAEDLLETELIDLDGGLTVDVGEAATGGALSTIPLLGIGLLRRRFML